MLILYGKFKGLRWSGLSDKDVAGQKWFWEERADVGLVQARMLFGIYRELDRRGWNLPNLRKGSRHRAFKSVKSGMDFIGDRYHVPFHNVATPDALNRVIKHLDEKNWFTNDMRGRLVACAMARHGYTYSNPSPVS